MDEVEISTIVYLSPEEIYDFLMDFPRYARYSQYLQEVRFEGDGSPGTRYFMTFGWWKITYTAHSEVTDVDEPHSIDWEITKDLDANGYWSIEPVPEEAPVGEDHACRVRLHVRFWPNSADESALDLPRFVSIDWVVEKAKPIIRHEAERVVQRIVADLEGERRDVDIEIHTTPDSV